MSKTEPTESGITKHSDLVMQGSLGFLDSIICTFSQTIDQVTQILKDMEASLGLKTIQSVSNRMVTNRRCSALLNTLLVYVLTLKPLPLAGFIILYFLQADLAASRDLAFFSPVMGNHVNPSLNCPLNDTRMNIFRALGKLFLFSVGPDE